MTTRHVLLICLLISIAGPSTAERLLGITAAGELIQIDPTNGSSALLANTGLSQVEALEADALGNLYAIADLNRLYRIDPSDPTNPALVGQISGFAVVESLAYDACNRVLYGAAHASNVAVSDTLIAIDTRDATPTVIGTFGNDIEDLDGLAGDSGGDFYGFDLDGFGALGGRSLVSVDVHTPSASVIAQVNESIFGLDFDSNDVLYGARVPNNFGGATTLVTLTTSGVPTTIGPTGYNSVTGLVFVEDPGDLLAITADGLLLEVDRDTGAATLIADTGLGQVEAMEADRNGLLYVIANWSDLYTVDRSDPTNPVFKGTVSDMGNDYAVVESLAFDPTGTVLYGMAHETNIAVSDTLVVIDTANGNATPLGTFGNDIEDLDGFASDANGNFFGFDLDGFGTLGGRSLVAVDVQTPSASIVAMVNHSIFGLDFSPSGVLYGSRVPSNFGGAATLVTLTTAGALTTIGAMGFDDVSGLVFVPEAGSELVGLTFDGDLLHIDPVTGQGTFVAATGLSQVEALEVEPGGHLLAIASLNTLYRIDRGNPTNPVLIGTVSNSGNDYAVVESLAFDPTGTVLYGMAHETNTAVSDTLVVIDTRNGNATPLGTFGNDIEDLDGLASNLAGSFYGFDLDGFGSLGGRSLVSVDVQTPSASIVAMVNHSIFGLDFSPDDVLFGSRVPSNFGGAATLVTLGLDGTLTTIGPIGFDDVQIVFAPPPCDSPSPPHVPLLPGGALLGLAASLLLAGAFAQRRRSPAGGTGTSATSTD